MPERAGRGPCPAPRGAAGKWGGAVSWALAVTAVLLALVTSVAAADALDDETRRIAKRLQCPVCESVSVADSPSELATQMRAVIRRKLEQGESEDQILAYFTERYGEGVLVEPPRRGLGLAVWLIPLAALGSGSAILLLTLRRWSRPRTKQPAPSAGPWAQPTPALFSDKLYAERARAELEDVRRET